MLHGFRSTTGTLINELGFNRDWIERQLAQGERYKVRAAYNYSEHLPERRKMMQTRADYLDRLRIGAKVIPLVSVRWATAVMLVSWSNTGQTFWRCSRFPVSKGIRDL